MHWKTHGLRACQAPREGVASSKEGFSGASQGLAGSPVASLCCANLSIECARRDAWRAVSLLMHDALSCSYIRYAECRSSSCNLNTCDAPLGTNCRTTACELVVRPYIRHAKNLMQFDCARATPPLRKKGDASGGLTYKA